MYLIGVNQNYIYFQVCGFDMLFDACCSNNNSNGSFLLFCGDSCRPTTDCGNDKLLYQQHLSTFTQRMLFKLFVAMKITEMKYKHKYMFNSICAVFLLLEDNVVPIYKNPINSMKFKVVLLFFPKQSVIYKLLYICYST